MMPQKVQNSSPDPSGNLLDNQRYVAGLRSLQRYVIAIRDGSPEAEDRLFELLQVREAALRIVEEEVRPRSVRFDALLRTIDSVLMLR